VLDPLIVGVLATAVSLGGAGRPSFWYDEAATISASYTRSLRQLWAMLSNVDAVHGLYYVLMHGWFQIFPPTEFWSRAPRGLAVIWARPGDVDSARRISRADVVGARCFRLCPPAKPTCPCAVRRHIGSGVLCCGAVCDEGLRSSASDHLDRTDWAPDDRGRG